MFHVNGPCAVTRDALERSGVLQGACWDPGARVGSEIIADFVSLCIVHARTPWEDMEGGLYRHVEQINKDLRRMGLDPLSRSR